MPMSPGVILPARDQSTVEWVKADLRLRYFQNQPVHMELLGEADDVRLDTEEVRGDARLQLRVDDQVWTDVSWAVSCL